MVWKFTLLVKDSAITNVGTPRNVSDVGRFLAKGNQVRKFVPNLAEETKPFRDLPNKDYVWTWDQPQHIAFKKLKESLSDGLVLALYNTNAKRIVSGDASSHGLGAVLVEEEVEGAVKPVSYISKRLSTTLIAPPVADSDTFSFTIFKP